MADLVFAIRPDHERSGEEHTQATVSSTNASAGVAIVPAVTDKLAVIDYLAVKTAAAETWFLYTTGGELITSNITAVDTWEVFDTPIQANAKGLAISIDVTAGAVAVFLKYHYER